MAAIDTGSLVPQVAAPDWTRISADLVQNALPRVESGTVTPPDAHPVDGSQTHPSAGPSR